MAPPTREKKLYSFALGLKGFPPLPFFELDEQGRLTCPLELRAVKSQGRP